MSTAQTLTLTPRLWDQARVGDGLVAVADLARARPGRLDLLVVDAGADDASLAMSCPPAPFLQAPTLPYTLP